MIIYLLLQLLAWGGASLVIAADAVMTYRTGGNVSGVHYPLLAVCLSVAAFTATMLWSLS